MLLSDITDYHKNRPPSLSTSWPLDFCSSHLSFVKAGWSQPHSMSAATPSSHSSGHDDNIYFAGATSWKHSWPVTLCFERDTSLASYWQEHQAQLAAALQVLYWGYQQSWYHLSFILNHYPVSYFFLMMLGNLFPAAWWWRNISSAADVAH